MSFITTLIDVVLQQVGQTWLRDSVSCAAKPSALPPGRMKQTGQTKGKASPLPARPGVYRHVDKVSGAIAYIGQTDNLRKRQQEHVREGRLDTSRQYVQYGVAKPAATKADLCDTERSHIGRHKPEGNATQGGNGNRSLHSSPQAVSPCLH